MISRNSIRKFLPTSCNLLKSRVLPLKNPSIAPKAGNLALPVVPRETQRWFSQAVKTNELPVVDYDYVKKAAAQTDVMIVDVREPDEIKEHGKIPNSVNIPLGEINTMLTMRDKEFETLYQRPKPKNDTEIIFYCMIGKRSEKAQKHAQSIGFRNVKNYLGSWNDWAVKSK